MDLYKPKDDEEYRLTQEGRHVHNSHEYPLSPWHLELLNDADFKLESPILDVGTRNGLFLDELKKRGFDAIGIEVTDIADYAISMGRNVVKGDIQKRTQWADGYFKTVVATHVIEHLYDPEAGLREIRRILDGYLYVAFPLQGDIASGNWLHLGHYSGYDTIDAMAKLLTENGFEIIKKIDGGVWMQTIIAKTI